MSYSQQEVHGCYKEHCVDACEAFKTLRYLQNRRMDAPWRIASQNRATKYAFGNGKAILITEFLERSLVEVEHLKLRVLDDGEWGSKRRRKAAREE